MSTDERFATIRRVMPSIWPATAETVETPVVPSSTAREVHEAEAALVSVESDLAAAQKQLAEIVDLPLGHPVNVRLADAQTIAAAALARLGGAGPIEGDEK